MTDKRRDELLLRILKQIQSDVAGLKRDVAGLKGDGAGLKGELSDLRAEMRAGFAEVNRRLDGHRAFAVDRLRDHHRQLREQSQHLLRIDSRLDRLESF